MSGSERPAERSEERPDLRLLPLVAAMWIAQLGVLLIGPRAAHPAAIVGVVSTGGALAWAAAHRRRVRDGWIRHPPATPLRAGSGSERDRGPRHLLAVLVVAGLGLGASVAGLHLARLHPPALTALAEARTVVRVDARVTGDPRAHLSIGEGSRPATTAWSVTARLETVVVRGRAMRVRVPVVLRGDAVRALPYGARVSLAARADEAWTPASQSLSLQVLGRVDIRSPPGAIASGTNRIRAAFRAACAGLPPDAGALLLGLAVGDESTLPVALDDAMLRAGLSHLTAVSGSNTALVMGLALAAVAALGWGWRIRIAVSLAVLAGYVALVRPQPSVLRAAAMGVVALIALGAGGRRRGTSALLSAALVLLVAVPELAVSLGFALSVAATAGLLLVGPGLAERLARWRATRRIPEPIRAALAVAAAAHLATLPLAVLMGNGASVVALPANVLVTPLVPIATVVGLAAALIAPWWLTGASLLAHLGAPATAAIAWVAHTASALPIGVIDVPGGAWSALAVAAGLAVAGVIAHRGWRRLPRGALAALGAAAAVVVAGVLATRAALDARWPPPDWLVLACDVGQGDAVLVRTPGASQALLVDVGPQDGGVADCVADAGIRRVVVLLTHFHADHIDGLADLLAASDVAAVLTSAVAEPAEGARSVTQLLAGAGATITPLRAGQCLSAVGLSIEIRWPARRIGESPENNSSVVALVEVPAAEGGGNGLRVLLTGDVEPEAQGVLLAGTPPDADVVKVPHHGSRYQSPGLARWSGARIALVSAGQDNDYGHPSPTTLAQYQAVGALIGRTDQDGALAVVVRDGRPSLLTQR